MEWLCCQRLTKNVSFVSSARDFWRHFWRQTDRHKSNYYIDYRDLTRWLSRGGAGGTFTEESGDRRWHWAPHRRRHERRRNHSR